MKQNLINLIELIEKTDDDAMKYLYIIICDIVKDLYMSEQ